MIRSKKTCRSLNKAGWKVRAPTEMLIAAAVLLIAVTVLFTFSIRAKDMPAPEPLSPTRHLDERRAAIYENLRDLQFEYRVGKLSDADYQQTKVGLQKELAGVLAEIERVNSGAPRAMNAAENLSPELCARIATRSSPSP